MKTSNSCWKKPLRESLKRAARKADARLAILGIGNELNGDDAAGVWLARRLLSLLPADENVLVLDCGPAPENALGALRRFGPGLVLLLDAADFGGAAGEVRWIDPLQTSGFSASSHSLPFAVLAAYLARELACQVALLGIQPAGLEFDAGLSSPVKNSLSLLLKDLLALLQE